MTQELPLKVPQLSDRALISKLADLNTKFSIELFSATLPSVPEINAFPTKNDQGKFPDPWEAIYDLNSSLVQSLHVRIAAITIIYYRRGRDKSSAVYDEIVLHFNTNFAMETLQKIQVIGWVEKTFKAFDPKRALALTPEAVELSALHESTLSRLEEIAGKVIEDTAEAYKQLEQRYLSKRDSLEEEFSAIRTDLDAEHNARMSALQMKEAELIARQESIDDRNNTHARRATRNAMLEDVKERILDFGVSSNTAAKRRNVSYGFFALFAVLIALLAWSLVESSQLHGLRSAVLASKADTKGLATAAVWDKTDLYVVWARISILTIGLLFSILYYIKWENRWAEQHATAEFQLQQFYVDVNRANWVVESGLEWHKETSSTIPDTIMQSLTTNLFRHADEVPPALHPADELASALLGSASKLKLKAGDSELEFDKPGKIKEKT